MSRYTLRPPTTEETRQLIDYICNKEAWRAMASEEDMKAHIAKFLKEDTDIGVTENYEIPKIEYDGKVMVAIYYTGKQPNKEVYIWDKNGDLKEIAI